MLLADSVRDDAGEVHLVLAFDNEQIDRYHFCSFSYIANTHVNAHGNGLNKMDGFAWEENKRDDRIAKPMILLVQSQ